MMTEAEITIQRLDGIEAALEEHIAYAAMTSTENLWHEGQERVVRAFWFSRGTRETTVVIDEDGGLLYFAHFGGRTAKQLLPDICAALLVHLWKRE